MKNVRSRKNAAAQAEYLARLEYLAKLSGKFFAAEAANQSYYRGHTPTQALSRIAQRSTP